jgi:hypothetical protein
VKLIDRVANLGFVDLSDEGVRAFPLRCSELMSGRIEPGLTMDDVLLILRETGLESHKRKFPQQATVQLISTRHELRDSRFLYRHYRTLAS